MTRRRQLVAALILVALALITLDFRETGGPVSAMQRGADAAFSPLQGGVASIVRPVGDFFGSILEVGTLRSQVRQLEADNAELVQQLRVQADLERRLADAEALLGFAAERQVELVGARVIAAPPGNFDRTIVIDVGAAQGVAPEMAVVNSRGVVGIVQEVTSTRARVNLLSSTEGRLGVRIAQTGGVGLLTGQGSGLLRLEMFDSGAAVPADGVVVSQSFQGSLVPGGLPVGVVEAEGTEDLRGERFIEVRPYVSFGSLSSVAVVVAGRETGGEFAPSDVIEGGRIVPAPTVTRSPDPDAAATDQGAPADAGGD